MKAPDGTGVILGVIMDPIATIHVEKDTTLSLLLEAQRRGWVIHYLEMTDLWLRDGVACGRSRRLTVRDDPRDCYGFGETREIALTSLDVVFMRKDPPFDAEYLYATHLLDRVAAAGTLVVNAPQALRDIGEKTFLATFPDLAPPTLIARDPARLHAFIEEQGDAVLKPLDLMGGQGVFRVRRDDPNRNVIVETLNRNGAVSLMAQRFLPEIADGDKRILMIEGHPVDYALARIPKAGEFRGNLAAGGHGEGRPLTARDRAIAARVGPVLKEQGVLFAGLDVIGDWLTEINVTSPTGARQLDRQFGISVAAQLLDAIAERLLAAGS